MSKIKANVVCLVLAATACIGIACNPPSESSLNTQPAPASSPAETMLEDERAERARSFSSTPGATEAPLDLQFIDTISAHHREAMAAVAAVVVMLVESKAAHDELKEFARKVKEDFESEIKQLSAWRVAWYGDAPLAINAKIVNQVELTNAMDVRDLSEATEAEFDELFIDMMWLHNHDAAQVVQAAQAQVAHPELKEFAAKMLEARQAELMLLNRWRAEWRDH